MKIVPSETTLVVAGAWNAAILTPDWVIRHGLKRVPEQRDGTAVQVLIPAGPFGVLEAPRFSLEGFSFTARSDALVLLPDATDDVSLRRVEELAANILTTLNHTPIAGIGHNFEFISDDPDRQWPEAFNSSQIDLIDASPSDWEAYRTVLATQFKCDQIQVNVQRYAEGPKIGIKFNFHHPVSSADKGREVLTGIGYRSFWDNFKIAEQLVSRLFGETKP